MEKQRQVMRGLSAWAAIAAAPMLTWVIGRGTWEYLKAVEGFASGGAWTVDQAVVVIVGCLGTVAAAYLCVTAIALIAAFARPSGVRAVRSGRAPEVGALARVGTAAPVAWQRVVAVAMAMLLGSGIGAPAMAAVAGDEPGPVTNAGWVAGPVDATETPEVPESPEMPEVPEESNWAESNTAEAEPAAPLAEFVDLAAPSASAAPETATPESATPDHAAPEAPTPPAVAEAPPAIPDTYTVVRGDSLWNITAALLGGGASNASIAATWPVLYEANRDVIGANPSLIHPGQVLTIPEQVRA